jgi:hypothetical protein
VHEAREVEVVALLLAAAAVRDDERAASLDANEVEEPQPWNANERAPVEVPIQAETIERRDRDRMVDEEQGCASGCVGQDADRLR